MGQTDLVARVGLISGSSFSMACFSSASFADFEQVNVSWDVSKKPDLLQNNFKISRSSYYFV